MILLLGGSGMLGTALADRLESDARDFVRTSREELDLARPGSIEPALERIAPRTVINAAAFTDVNRAELPECRSEVFRVNRDGPAALARECAVRGVELVHVSTDYVFDGSKGSAYVEDDPVGPLQVYGRSKLEGERAVASACPAALIVRTSTLYGPGQRGRPHYVDAIREQARVGAVVEVVELPVASPTLSHDLADGILALVAAGARGVVHVVNHGACSRLELARAVLELTGSSDRVELRTRAAAAVGPRRPDNSSLSTDRFAELTGGHLRPWREALERYLASV